MAASGSTLQGGEVAQVRSWESKRGILARVPISYSQRGGENVEGALCLRGP